MKTTITVTECAYIGSTVNGNSRYRIADQTGKSRNTKPDANFAHGIVSGRTGVQAQIVVNGRGVITDFHYVD